MQTPGPVARLAAHVRDLLWSFAPLRAGLTYDCLFCLQACMRSCSKIAHDLFVAGRAFLRANELRAGDTGRGENCSIRRAAGKQNHGQRDGSTRTPQQAFALTVDPSSKSRSPHEGRVCAETEKSDNAFFRIFSDRATELHRCLRSMPSAARYWIGNSLGYLSPQPAQKTHILVQKLQR